MKCRECNYQATNLATLRNHWAGLHTQQYLKIQAALDGLEIAAEVKPLRIRSDVNILPVDIWLKH